MLITFLVSSLAHELVMSCITKKLRGYGFISMMLQLPIVTVQKSKYFRGKTTLNVSDLPYSSLGLADMLIVKNTFFWFSMILGLSMMCALYVLV